MKNNSSYKQTDTQADTKLGTQAHVHKELFSHSEKNIIKESVLLAESWQKRANAILTKEEKAIQSQMLRLLTNPVDKIILTKMIDQSFRSHNPDRVADQINNLLRSRGVPDFFSGVEKLLVRMFLGLGRHFPYFSIPKMIGSMRNASSRAIIPGEKEKLYAHLEKRKAQNVRMNINHLGEAVLGEGEAKERLKTYIKDMEDPAVEYISVKISTIYSQISSLAFDDTVAVLKERLSRLYKVAMDNFFVRNNGQRITKFVNLDMEEYRDLEITVEAFIQTLDQEELQNYSAGIVLQAYLPDSHNIQKKLTEWAKNRVKAGGAPVKLRIVKGANMEMEMVESSLFNWPLATYDNKLDVDANYKKMVSYGMEPENIKAINLGIASHNLFELAYAYNLAKKNRVENYFYFEMLEGMADHVRRALCETSGDVLLYAPVAGREQFINAIAYLIRRLDENTAKENFLRYSPKLQVNSDEWEFLKKAFTAACIHKDKVATAPNRTQDRNKETFDKAGTFYENEFNNEPDTDFSLSQNRYWAKKIRDSWKKKKGDKAIDIPLIIAGEEIKAQKGQREIKECIDPSQLKDNITVFKYGLANEEDIERCIKAAKDDSDKWRDKSYKERHKILSKVAFEVKKNRANLIGAAAANTGKIFTEADVEVSEAIDFLEYYPYSARAFAGFQNLECSGKGVGLVISPWNFPIAIPCGGIAASLAAGNTVIFKPASSAVLVAWELCKCFWKAGVSKNTLQFVPCQGSSTGQLLSNHPDIDFIILTGGTDTGLKILQKRPDIYLAAETGGKNATIVTAMADRDQAIKNVIYSAFGNSGQKCSATSLLILEKEVYEDDNFKKQLIDAAKSISTGSAWNFKNKIGPLIAPPKGDLKKALTELEPAPEPYTEPDTESGESWALKPKMIDDNPYIWTLGIKWGVSVGSYTHKTEFFGPLLAVIKADDLEHAIKITNDTGYGLTSGIESLDEREQNLWKEKTEAGNLYINRGTTGAIVLRQPFGGMKKSALGAGIKAGGPNYVSQFMNIKERAEPSVGAIKGDYYLLRLVNSWRIELAYGKFLNSKSGNELADKEKIKKIIRAVKSYIFWAEQEFFKEKDYFKLRGQDNITRYLPVKTMLIRLHAKDTLFDTLARIAAAKVAGATPVVSMPKALDTDIVKFLYTEKGRQLLQDTTIIKENDKALTAGLLKYDRIRYAAPDRVPDIIFKKAAETGAYISRTKPVMEGRIELIQYFREQSICNNYHRYGNIGERGLGGACA